MKQLLLISVCLMLLSGIKCYARIGETLEQCEKRYGKIITDKKKIFIYGFFLSDLITNDKKIGKDVMGFITNDKEIGKDGGVKINGETYYFFRLDQYGICVKLFEEKVDAIRFIKFGEWDLPVELSKVEMDAFIHANEHVKECVNYVNGWGGEKYLNEAGGNILVITTKEYNNKIEKQKELLRKEEDEKQKNVLKKF